MPKPHVIVLSITHQGLSKKQVAHKYSVSIRWINMLLARYYEHGLEGLEPRSRKPHKSPNRLSQEVIDQVLAARFELTQQGLDNGPKSIGWRLQNQGFTPPSPASIWRILVRNGAIDPQPKKRPRSSYIRFQAEQPNELWQSDFTHWPLADGTDVEILNWLDDHSRFLLSCTAHIPVRASDVVENFLKTVSRFGPPQSTLTDNGLVYTSRFVGGKNPFEYTLGNLGIQQKNGSPGHPQTQGKIERFHQTLKRYLAQQPKAQTVEELQAQLDQFKLRYNTQRPHSSLGQQTPKAVYSQTPKATPTTPLKSVNKFDRRIVRIFLLVSNLWSFTWPCKTRSWTSTSVRPVGLADVIPLFSQPQSGSAASSIRASVRPDTRHRPCGQCHSDLESRLTQRR